MCINASKNPNALIIPALADSNTGTVNPNPGTLNIAMVNNDPATKNVNKFNPSLRVNFLYALPTRYFL